MLPRSLLLALVATSCHSQYQMESDLRADITFNADNDRFDMGNIIDEQKRAFKVLPSQMEEDWRRNHRPLAEILRHARRRYQRVHDKSLRRVNNDFAYHDQMLDENDYIEGQYNNNLETFRPPKQSPSRKSDTNFLFKNVRNEPNKKSNSKNQKSIIEGLQDVVLNYLHGGKVKPGRRMSDTNPENEILLHYAVPLRMKVKGYLEMPQGQLA